MLKVQDKKKKRRMFLVTLFYFDGPKLALKKWCLWFWKFDGNFEIYFKWDFSQQKLLLIIQWLLLFDTFSLLLQARRRRWCRSLGIDGSGQEESSGRWPSSCSPVFSRSLWIAVRSHSSRPFVLLPTGPWRILNNI